MIGRFALYSILKNLRFFEAFFLIYLLAGPEVGGPRLDYLQIGLLVGYQKLLTGWLEVPFGVLTDRFGRRRALATAFGCYSLAFPGYAVSGGVSAPLQLPLLYLAQTLFGIGEALRTGSHKAIMLDWADQTGRSSEATRLIGLTRFFSKTSAGLSALVGGLIVYLYGSLVGLFWAATVPALLGVFLMLSYPVWLDGEMSRQPERDPRPSLGERFRRLWAAPGILLLLLQSVLFESQIKLAQHYLQPFLKAGLQDDNVAIIGALGALVIGGYYLVQDSLGGLSSMAAVPLERALGGASRANGAIHLAAVVLATLVAASLFLGWLAVGLLGFVGLAALQNARRPVFVAGFNTVMDKPQRATMLSIESQARSWCFALLAPASGWLADNQGLEWAVLAIAVILAIGLLPLAPVRAADGQRRGEADGGLRS